MRTRARDVGAAIPYNIGDWGYIEVQKSTRNQGAPIDNLGCAKKLHIKTIQKTKERGTRMRETMKCKYCNYYAEFEGVCCCPDSGHVADYMDGEDWCNAWSRKKSEKNIAKEYLQQVRNADLKIQEKLEEVAALEVLATKVSALNEGDRVKSSGDQDKMAQTVCKIADMKNEIQEEIENMLKLKREIRRTIEQVSAPIYMSVLYRRYILYKSWEQIATELCLSYRHTTRLHGEGLQEVEKILEKEVKKSLEKCEKKIKMS